MIMMVMMKEMERDNNKSDPHQSISLDGEMKVVGG